MLLRVTVRHFEAARPGELQLPGHGEPVGGAERAEWVGNVYDGPWFTWYRSEADLSAKVV